MAATKMTFNSQPWHIKGAVAVLMVFCLALFTSVALTNFAMLGLAIVAPFAWREFYQSQQSLEPAAKIFLGLVLALCGWDVCTNVLAGNGLALSTKALWHDMRTLGFVVLFWAIFVNAYVARVAFFSILLCVLALASTNLFLTLIGRVPQGQYFTTGLSHLSHMYGQALVGLFFVLLQMWLVRPHLSWRVAVPMALLVLSLFIASERRTGWLLLAAGVCLWGLVNARRLFVGQYKWWLFLALLVAIGVAVSSDVVQSRMALAVVEGNQYFSMTPQQRAGAVFGAVSLRLQYAATVIEVIKQSNWWVGVGSIHFPQTYQAAATSLGVSPQAWATYNWGNPHNEYLFMLATKGVVGLALYVAIFVQACRVAWDKTDEVQRMGLVMFVFLFMLSITTNSMMIDMEEGHFTLLILLIFLAPKSLGLAAPQRQTFMNVETSQ